MVFTCHCSFLNLCVLWFKICSVSASSSWGLSLCFLAISSIRVLRVDVMCTLRLAVDNVYCPVTVHIVFPCHKYKYVNNIRVLRVNVTVHIGVSC